MTYKPEHISDLESGAIVTAQVRPGDAADNDESLTFDRTLFIEGRNPAGTGMVTRNTPGGGIELLVLETEQVLRHAI